LLGIIPTEVLTMNNVKVEFTREKLYEEVWRKKEYGISDWYAGIS